MFRIIISVIVLICAVINIGVATYAAVKKTPDIFGRFTSLICAASGYALCNALYVLIGM